MGRILTGGMFKERRFQPRVRDDAADLRKSWKSPSGMVAAAKLAGAAGSLIGGLPNPFRSSPDLSEKGLRSSSALLKRAAQRRSEMTAGDRYSVAQKIERDSREQMRPKIEEARSRVQEMGGAELRPEERQAAAGFGATPAESRQFRDDLSRRREVGESPDPTEMVTSFDVVYENLSDPEKRKNIDQATLEQFYQGVSSGGRKRALLKGGANPEEVNAAQEIAQMELSRRGQQPLREQIVQAEDVVDVQTGEVAPDQVERFDETIVQLDPVYRGLVGLSRDEARSKILIAARVADTKKDQDLLRKQWELLDAPRETIGDLFKSSEQVQREHRKELEQRFAKLRRPEKGISAKDQAYVDLTREKIADLQHKRTKEDKKKGVRRGRKGMGLESWYKLLGANIDDINKGMPERKFAEAKVKSLEKAASDLIEAGGVVSADLQADIDKAKAEVARLNKAAAAYRSKLKQYRAKILATKKGSKAAGQLGVEIFGYLDGQPYFTSIQTSPSGSGGVDPSKVSGGVGLAVGEFSE